MNDDVLLTRDGDIYVDENGGTFTTGSVAQAARVRLRWVLGEWPYAPQHGMPYYEDVLAKAPDPGRIRRAVRDELAGIAGVDAVRDIDVSVDRRARTAKASFALAVGEEIYRDEVAIWLATG
jgi:hypothetical protein